MLGVASCEIFIHRMPQDHEIFHIPTWDRHVATSDLWPEELIDDITGWFDDLTGRWPDAEWWVQRIHGSSSSSRMTILQQVNYVLITRRAHAREFCPGRLLPAHATFLTSEISTESSSSSQQLTKSRSAASSWSDPSWKPLW